MITDQDSMPVVLSTGSSLAQDRGRMEARIEALTAEVSELKKECQVRLHITHDDKANPANSSLPFSLPIIRLAHRQKYTRYLFSYRKVCGR